MTHRHHLLIPFALAALLPFCATAEVHVKIEAGSCHIANEKVAVQVNLQTGRFDMSDLGTGTTVISNAWFRLDRSETREWTIPPHTYAAEQADSRDALGAGKRMRVWYRPSGSYDPERYLDFTIHEGSPAIAIGWGVRNPFTYDVRVRRAELVSGGELFGGRIPVDPRVLRSGAGAEPNIVGRDWRINALNGAMLTWRDDAAGGRRRTIVAGGLEYGEFIRTFRTYQPSPGSNERQLDLMTGDASQQAAENNATRLIDLIVWDPQGKRVAPGATWHSRDSIYLDVVTADPFASLEAYGGALAAANHANPHPYDFPTLCGWAVSTTHIGDGTPVNDSVGLVDQIDRAAKTGILKYTPMAVRLEPDFYCHWPLQGASGARPGDTIQGWWDDTHFGRYKSKHAPLGYLHPPLDTFAKFCAAVKKRGCIPFTYFQGSMPSNDFAVAHPDWMLGNDISLLHVDRAHQMPLVRFDYTDPDFQSYMLDVWKRLGADGLQGVKFDYPETAWNPQGGFEDKTQTTTSAYRKMFELCREGLGKDAWIHERIVHEVAPRTDACAGIVDLQRVWQDSSSFEPEMASRIGMRWFKQGRVFRYYPDGKSFYSSGDNRQTPLPAKDRRTFLSLIGLLSGRIELSNGFARLTPDMIHDITRMFPVLPNGMMFRPADFLTSAGHPSCYVLDLATDSRQVILVNNDRTRKLPVSAPLSGDMAGTGSLGLDPEKSYWVYDFWNQRCLGVFKGNDRLSVELEPGEALVYAVRPAGQAVVIGTDRHVLCGNFELRDIHADADGKTMQLQADLIEGESLRITLGLPDGQTIAGVTAGQAEASHAPGNRPNTAVVTLQSSTGGRFPVSIRFQQSAAH